MVTEHKKSLSQEDIDFIVDLVKMYNLGPTDPFSPEMEEILSKAKTEEERIEIINNLPFNKIMDRLKEILEGKFSVKDLPTLLKEDLNISNFLAEKIGKEIAQNIFKEEVPQLKKEEEPKKPTPPPSRDIYREPIE